METQIAQLVTGDFQERTLTLELDEKEEMVIQTGKFAIVPIDDYNKLIAREAILSEIEKFSIDHMDDMTLDDFGLWVQEKLGHEF